MSVQVKGNDFKWLRQVIPSTVLVNEDNKEVEANYVSLHKGVAYENNLTIEIVQIDTITDEVRRVTLSRESFAILKEWDSDRLDV